MDSWLQDLRYAIRAMLKSPGFTVIAILSLALGIGANTSIFSVVNSLLLKPLPYRSPERLAQVFLEHEEPGKGIASSELWSYPKFVALRDNNESFEQVATVSDQNFSVTDSENPERLSAEMISANYFPMLGVEAAVGRTFTAEEDQTPGAHPVALIGYGLWQRRFESDSSVIGKTISLNKVPLTIVGVLPEGFKGQKGTAEVWVPMMMAPQLTFARRLAGAFANWTEVIARLKPGVSMAQAQSEMEIVAVKMREAIPVPAQYASQMPDSDAVLLQLASVAEQQDDFDGAIALYKKIPDASPLKRAAEMQLGLNLADLKRYDEAIPHLKKLLEADPDDMRAYLALGGVYASKEDYKSAAATYDQAVEHLKNPTSANWNIFYQRGIAYERLKQWPKAEPNFRKALELYPDQPQVMNYLGYSWVDMNMNLEEALDLIRKAVDLRPSDGYIVDSLGWAYYRLNRFDESVVELERAVSLKPDDPVLNDHLGDAYWRAGRKLEATFQWAHARDLKPEPDVLLSVQRKLKEGLPPLEGKTALEAPDAAGAEAGSRQEGLSAAAFGAVATSAALVRQARH